METIQSGSLFQKSRRLSGPQMDVASPRCDGRASPVEKSCAVPHIGCALSLISIQLALACCKPGTVQLYALAGGATAWAGARTFALRTQRLSVDASALHPATGLEYIPARDAFLVGLFDGSFHVVNAVSTAPRVDAPDASADGEESDSFSTENISQRARAVFVRTETEGLPVHPRGKTRVQITPKDANRTSGLVSYDGGSTLVWLHE
jgi:general transcription factor 3C protein 4